MPLLKKVPSVDAPGVSVDTQEHEVKKTLLTCPIRGPLTAAALAKDGLTPTEEARRIEFLQYLIQRGYPTPNIAVETVVLSGLGNSGRNSLRADVIVYDRPVAELRATTKEHLDHALVIAEIKRDSKGRDSGLKFQLEPALRLVPSTQVLGAYWDDVNRILLHKKVSKKNGVEQVDVLRDALANLPPYGQPYQSQPLTLAALIPAENLVATLQNIANVMRSHGVNDEHLRYKESVKLLLARYIDEKEAKSQPRGQVSLQVYSGADPTFEDRVGKVYDAAARRYSRAVSLFKPSARSELATETLKDCVRVIQGINLSSASSDALQQVFMSFVPAVFKKSLDQYFTPVTLIESMVEMTAIGPTDKVADPAMGTADFLTAAMTSRAEAGDDDAPQRVFGADKDDKAYDLAVINMILHRDGQATLQCIDSIEHVTLWEQEMNVALCNPPFGARTVESRPDVLKHYDLGHAWKWDTDAERYVMTDDILESQQLGLLFIERCYRLLAEGGRLAIIVPEGYLCTAAYAHIRQWILDHFQVLALVELPRRIFLKSDADLRSNILVARRLAKPGTRTIYPIFTDLVRKVGYKLGKGFSVVSRKDPETGLEMRDENNELLLDTDFAHVRSGFAAFKSATADAMVVPDGWEGATSADIFGDPELDMKPRRLMPRALANLRKIRSEKFVRLGDIAEIVDDAVDILAKPYGPAELRRAIEGQNVRAVEGTVIPQEPERCWSIAARKSPAMYEVRDRDIAIGLVRPERRNIGLVIDDGDDLLAAPDGVAIVRPWPESADSYPAGWLFAALRSEACRIQFWTESGGTSYGKLTRSQIEDVLVPDPGKQARLDIAAKVGEWAASVKAAAGVWNSIGTEADRKPILNSPIFGLGDEEVTGEEIVDD